MSKLFTFNMEERIEAAQRHFSQVVSIGVPANAAKATIAFDDLEVARETFSKQYGEGSKTSYVPLVKAQVDADGYIAFNPTLSEVTEYFKNHLSSFAWTKKDASGNHVISDREMALAVFEYRNMMNGDAQIVIDDNKKLTGHESLGKLNVLKLLGMFDLKLMSNLDGKYTQAELDEWNKRLYKNQPTWKFFGKSGSLIAQIDTATETTTRNGRIFVADPEHAARLAIIQELATLMDEAKSLSQSVEYSSADNVRIKELRGDDKGVVIASNILRDIFGEYYSLLIFAEEYAKDQFARDNEDEDLSESFAALELGSELSDQKQKGLAKFANMGLNALSFVSNKTFAANMLMAAKRGKLNVAGGGSSMLTTSFPKHAYLLLDELSNPNDVKSKLASAKLAGERIQVVNNEAFEEGQMLNIINGTGIEGYQSTITKMMEFKGEAPAIFATYIDDKLYAAYNLVEQLESSIDEDKAEAAENQQAILSIDLDGASGTYEKETGVINYGDAVETIEAIHAAIEKYDSLIVSFVKDNYALFAEKDNSLQFIARLSGSRGKDFGPGLLRTYLHGARVEVIEDFTGVISRNNNGKGKQGRVSMMLTVDIVGKYDGDIPAIEDAEDILVEFDEELADAVLIEDKKDDSNPYGNVFGKLSFSATQDNEKTIIENNEDSNIEFEETDEDDFSELYGDDDDFEEEDEEFEIGFEETVRD